MAHVCFHERKWVHTRLSEKDRTQGLTRRSTGHFGCGVVSLPSERSARSRTSPGRVSERRTLPPFPGSLWPPTISRREKVGKTAATALSPNRFSSRFSTSRTNGPHSLLRMKVGTLLAFANRIAHKGLHTETRGVSDGGGITTLGAFRTFTNIPGPGIRKVYFAAFGSWPRVLPKNAESLGTAMRLCVSLFRRRRGPAGLRDPVSALLIMRRA